MNRKGTARCGIALAALAFVTMACAIQLTQPPTPQEAKVNRLVVQITKEAAIANDYNAHATAQILVAQGDNAVSMARSTAIVADSDQGPINTYLQGKKDGQNENKGPNIGDTMIVVIAIAVLAFLVLGAMAR